MQASLEDELDSFVSDPSKIQSLPPITWNPTGLEDKMLKLMNYLENTPSKSKAYYASLGKNLSDEINIMKN